MVVVAHGEAMKVCKDCGVELINPSRATKLCPLHAYLRQMKAVGVEYIPANLHKVKCAMCGKVKNGFKQQRKGYCVTCAAQYFIEVRHRCRANEWRSEKAERPAERICLNPDCQKPFPLKAINQYYCTNVCGSAGRRLGIRVRAVSAATGIVMRRSEVPMNPVQLMSITGDRLAREINRILGVV